MRAMLLQNSERQQARSLGAANAFAEVGGGEFLPMRGKLRGLRLRQAEGSQPCEEKSGSIQRVTIVISVSPARILAWEMPLLKRINGGFVEQPPCNLRRALVFYSVEGRNGGTGLRSRTLFASLVLFAGFTQTGCAQELVQAPRADGAQTPLRVYTPDANGCAPLALISPGAGGSEDGYNIWPRRYATTDGAPS